MAPGGCLPPHKAGHWVFGLQVIDPSAADAMVQGTLTICKDNTGLTNKPCGLHATGCKLFPQCHKASPQKQGPRETDPRSSPFLRVTG